MKKITILIDWLIDWVENSMILVFVGFRQHYNHWPGRWEPCNRRLLNYRIWGDFFLKLYPPFLIDFYRHSLLKLAWGEKKIETQRLVGHFRVLPSRCIKTRLSAQPLIWKWFFILVQIKIIFTKKRLCTWPHFKSEFLELGSGPLIWQRWRITLFILLHEKFLQFDWLRAVAFQLNWSTYMWKLQTFCG